MSKKALNLIQGYHPVVGGAEKFIKILSEYQSNELGYEVEVWTTNVRRPDQYWNIREPVITPRNEMINGVSVTRFPIGRGVMKNMRMNKFFSIVLSRIPEFNLSNYFSPPTSYEMLDIVNSDKLKDYDVVTVSATPYYFLFWIGWLISKKLDIPYVISPALHIGVGQDERLSRKYLKKTALPFFMHADKIILNTEFEGEAIKNFAKRYGKEIKDDKFLVTGQGVFIDKISGGDGGKFSEKYGLEYPIVFQVGSKNEEKGSYTLIEAMKKLWDKNKKAHLVFAGMPREEFSDYIDSLDEKYKKWILNIDKPTDEELWDLYDAGDIFSMVSKTDSFGIVYLEAWTYEIPVIGCNTEAIKQVVDNEKDGFLIEYDDDSALAEKIGLLLDDKKLREQMGIAGREKVENKYDWNKNLKKLGDMYESL